MVCSNTTSSPLSLPLCHLENSHRGYFLFFQACVERHCGLDFEDLRTDIHKFWHSGCPVCRGECDCAYCKRTRKAGSPVTPIVPRSATVFVPVTSPMGLSVLQQSGTASKKRKTPEKRRRKDDEEDEDDDVDASDEDGEGGFQMFLNSLKNEGAKEKEGRDQEGEGDSDGSSSSSSSPSSPRAMNDGSRPGRIPRKKRRRGSDDLTITSGGVLAGMLHDDNGTHVVRVTPEVIRKDGRYELIMNEASVEAFVGLTGAGEVLNHRHRTPTPPPPEED